MRIVLADDHALFRESLASLLKAHGYEVVGEAADGAAAIALARELLPDIVLMDLAMPRVDGLKATREIVTQLPMVKVVVLTGSHEDEDLFDSIKAGASGYLLKDFRAADVFECLDSVASGGARLNPSLARRVLAEFKAPPKTESAATADPDALTARETEVLELMVSGTTSNRHLAESLGVSENTVRFHVRNILDKLHLNNRTQAVGFALREGMVGTD